MPQKFDDPIVWFWDFADDSPKTNDDPGVQHAHMSKYSALRQIRRCLTTFDGEVRITLIRCRRARRAPVHSIRWREADSAYESVEGALGEMIDRLEYQLEQAPKTLLAGDLGIITKPFRIPKKAMPKLRKLIAAWLEESVVIDYRAYTVVSEQALIAQYQSDGTWKFVPEKK